MTASAFTALFVDDEADVLRGYERTLRRVISLHTANSGAEALERIRTHGPYAVIVSDMRMPSMTGLELLKQVQKLSPDTIRIMLTGNADQQTAIDAINEGDVFRFLTKPCEPKVLATAVISGYEQYKLQRAEKELLGRTLTGAVHALGEMLSMVNPAAGGRIARIESTIEGLADGLHVEMDWRLQLLPTLSQLGSVALPGETLCKAAEGRELNADERENYLRFPEVGARLVAAIPRLDDVAHAIRYQLKAFDGSGVPDDAVAGEDIPLGARLLRVACDYDALTASGLSGQRAAKRIREAPSGQYDPGIVAALIAYTDRLATSRRLTVRIKDLSNAMTLARDIAIKGGTLLMAEGQPITDTHRERLMAFWRNELIEETVEVFLVNKENQDAVAAA